MTIQLAPEPLPSLHPARPCGGGLLKFHDWADDLLEGLVA